MIQEKDVAADDARRIERINEHAQGWQGEMTSLLASFYESAGRALGLADGPGPREERKREFLHWYVNQMCQAAMKGTLASRWSPGGLPLVDYLVVCMQRRLLEWRDPDLRPPWLLPLEGLLESPSFSTDETDAASGVATATSELQPRPRPPLALHPIEGPVTHPHLVAGMQIHRHVAWQEKAEKKVCAELSGACLHGSWKDVKRRHRENRFELWEEMARAETAANGHWEDYAARRRMGLASRESSLRYQAILSRHLLLRDKQRRRAALLRIRFVFHALGSSDVAEFLGFAPNAAEQTMRRYRVRIPEIVDLSRVRGALLPFVKKPWQSTVDREFREPACDARAGEGRE
ncbi:MAG: hypothetical protein HY720_24165 [Planctomycetes bacterium]|nr:hypothetical protein [Planctomycetota bacterium]